MWEVGEEGMLKGEYKMLHMTQIFTVSLGSKELTKLTSEDVGTPWGQA